MWQVAHCPAITPWVAEWVNLDVVNVPPVVWQASQDRAVTMWVDDFPVALVPLWQVAHEPGATAVWLNDAGIR